MVELMLEAGADVNAKRGDKATALFLASMNGHTETVRLLLDVGANTDTEIKIKGKTYTSSDIAESNGHTEIVRILKENTRK
ncbi:MAG: ankyrin repeat domain-containing protein [Acidobacteriota bacterium]